MKGQENEIRMSGRVQCKKSGRRQLDDCGQPGKSLYRLLARLPLLSPRSRAILAQTWQAPQSSYPKHYLKAVQSAKTDTLAHA